MGLLPLEFTDCLTDSPYFRENLHAHERELEKTNSQIKELIRQVKDLLSAAKTLSRAQRNLASTLCNFNLDCIGNSQTDDEIVIAASFKTFGNLLTAIEDERDRMLERASQNFIDPIDTFRREQIGRAKEHKKKFDKETARFCSSLERHLNLSTRKSENSLQEADATLEMEQRHFISASLEYVLKLQEVHERKKFEFVERILSFMYGWLTFYHEGHEVAKDFKSFNTDLQIRVQRSREHFLATHDEAQNLMHKMLEVRKVKPIDPGSLNKMYTRQGYLFLMEKKLAFGTGWQKHYCQYQRDGRRFTMIPYNQTAGKMSSNSAESFTLRECVRRLSDSIEKRFCFDLIPTDPKSSNVNSTITSSSSSSTVYTFQALSEEDRKLWLDAMDAKDPPLPTSSTAKEQHPHININSTTPNAKNSGSGSGSNSTPGTGTGSGPGLGPGMKVPDQFPIDEVGFAFVRKCIEHIESRGLEDQGLYRVVGVSSKVNRLIEQTIKKGPIGRRRRRAKKKLTDHDDGSDSGDSSPSASDNATTSGPGPGGPENNNSIDEVILDFDHCDEIETKTITSALKNYFRHLREPLMTFRLHHAFIAAAKQENRQKRLDDIHRLVHQLPRDNFEMLHILNRHLARVASYSDKNLMTVSNLGVCFGPTLLRPEEESMAAIMDIKFGNVVVETLIENCDKIFTSPPEQQQQVGHPSGSGGGFNGGLGLNGVHRSPTSPINNNQSHNSGPPFMTSSLIPGGQMMNGNQPAGSIYGRLPVHGHHHLQGIPATAAVGGGGDFGYASLQRNSSGGQSSGHPGHQPQPPPPLARSLSHDQVNLGLAFAGQRRPQLYQNTQGMGQGQGGRLGTIYQYANSSIGPGPGPGVGGRPMTRTVHPMPPNTPQPTAGSGSNGGSGSGFVSQWSGTATLPNGIGQQQIQQQIALQLSGQGGHGGQGGQMINKSPSASNIAALLQTSPTSTMFRQTSMLNQHQQQQQQQQATVSPTLSSPTSSVLMPTSAGSNGHETQSGTTNLSPTTTQGTNHVYGSLNMTSNVIAGPPGTRRVRTLYACVGENDTELTFEPNMIIVNVRPSREPGWLEGNLNGRLGLIPENYVEFID